MTILLVFLTSIHRRRRRSTMKSWRVQSLPQGWCGASLLAGSKTRPYTDQSTTWSGPSNISCLQGLSGRTLSRLWKVFRPEHYDDSARPLASSIEEGAGALISPGGPISPPGDGASLLAGSKTRPYTQTPIPPMKLWLPAETSKCSVRNTTAICSSLPADCCGRTSIITP